MNDFYQRIGAGLIQFAQNSEGKLLLYCEVEEGVISADVFYQERIGGTVRFRFAPNSLRDLVYDFWNTGENKIAPRSWSVLQFVIEEGQFTVNLTYPDQLNEDESLHDRRPKAVNEHYKNALIDYSRPN